MFPQRAAMEKLLLERTSCKPVLGLKNKEPEPHQRTELSASRAVRGDYGMTLLSSAPKS